MEEKWELILFDILRARLRREQVDSFKKRYSPGFRTSLFPLESLMKVTPSITTSFTGSLVTNEVVAVEVEPTGAGRPLPEAVGKVEVGEGLFRTRDLFLYVSGL